MVARLCAVAFIAFAALLVLGNGIALAADDYSNPPSDDSYSTPDAEQQPPAPDDGSAAPPPGGRPRARGCRRRARAGGHCRGAGRHRRRCRCPTTARRARIERLASFPPPFWGR